MPKWLHDKLRKQAKKKGLKGDDAAAYIYGTLQNYDKGVKRKHKGSKVAKPH